MLSELIWSVDSMILKEDVLFGFGWAFHKEQIIMEIRVKLSSSSRVTAEFITADTGRRREDVKYAFPDFPNALNSGFLVFGAFHASPLGAVSIECLIEDGSIIELSVPSASIIRVPASNDAGKKKMLEQSRVFFKRGLHLIRARKFRSLFEKIQRYVKNRPRMILHKPTDLVSLLGQNKCKNLSLIVDHDLGGGANHYRDRLVESVIQDGKSVIILTYHVATLTYLVIVKNKSINVRYSLPNETFLLEAVKYMEVSDIIYNNAVSFPHPERIALLLIKLKQLTSARLKILVHDFYLVCPSHFLLNYAGIFCDIPDVNVCASCLPKNQQGFTTLFTARNITVWRSLWGGVLVLSDEIITFSNSSAQLLRKAYPQIESAKICVIPHKVEYLNKPSPRVTQTNQLHIGVVGQIGFHKGAMFVKALGQEIKRRNAGIKIVVIGTLESTCDADIVSQTGSYRHDDMSSLIEKSGTNIFLFPSICPETFSYVVQELMDMNLPVASFNFGAPAERLSSYPKGLVLDSMDPGGVLDNLISFHRKIYLTY